jgi:nitrogenase molybdenum-iron protein alpha/beta subunit
LRNEGCTLTGALSVTTAVRDAVSIIHGPDGCAHHNFSLLHALQYENDQLVLPSIISSSLRETDIVFGGEEALARVIGRAQERHPGAIFVLTSCVAAAIGDDVSAVCGEVRDIQVMVIPTGGFLGGGFHDGVISALVSLSYLGSTGSPSGMVNLVGEKNLEYEADANFHEVSRLLALLGVHVQLRFVRNCSLADIRKLGSASLNIMRDASLSGVGAVLSDRFGTPSLPAFPVGFEGTLAFLEAAGRKLGIDSAGAIASEEAYQQQVIGRFADLQGMAVRVREPGPAPGPVLAELEKLFCFDLQDNGPAPQIPDPLPVGTAGLSRMLHRWRRLCRA